MQTWQKRPKKASIQQIRWVVKMKWLITCQPCSVCVQTTASIQSNKKQLVFTAAAAAAGVRWTEMDRKGKRQTTSAHSLQLSLSSLKTARPPATAAHLSSFTQSVQRVRSWSADFCTAQAGSIRENKYLFICSWKDAPAFQICIPVNMSFNKLWRTSCWPEMTKTVTEQTKVRGMKGLQMQEWCKSKTRPKVGNNSGKLETQM